MKIKINSRQKGTTLVEVLALLFVFVVVSTVFLQAWSFGTKLIFETRNRLGAASLASEKMEIIRNLDYSAIGTKTPDGGGGWNYGLPGGDILQDESVTANAHTYQVRTFIQYIDDPFDGLVTGTTPIDTVPNDYKKVFVTVAWGTASSSQQVEVSSVFVPKGVEQSAGGGVLSINVLDLAGNGIADATVHIVNTAVSPHVGLTTNTDDTGNLMFPAAPASLQSYQISVSKSGYFPITTYPSMANGGTFTPVEPHASVVAGELNPSSLITDRSADITIKTKDGLSQDLPSVAFQLVGGKQIGTAPITYTLNENDTSGAGASFTESSVSPGTYTITPTIPAQHILLRMEPPGVTASSFVVSAGVNSEETLFFADMTIGSVLATVTDQSTTSPLAGASVQLTNSITGYDVTLTTDQFGRAYFPTSAPALPAGTYDLKVTAAGFQDQTKTISVSGSLLQESVDLIAS
ncbi:MAG: carboxypeptidase-like regulatory domain-containing protein [Candidatus Moraniibacteriota bacterium]